VRPVIITLGLTLVAIILMYSLWSSLGYKMLMLGLGWPHVILGFVFYSALLWRAMPALGLLCDAGAADPGDLDRALRLRHCALIYVYFLYHAFRDDILVRCGRERGRDECHMHSMLERSF